MKKVMLFIEGTAFNTKLYSVLFTPKAYTPIGNSIQKINEWYGKYEVVLCTFRKRNIKIVEKALTYYGVQYHNLEYRREKESYADVVERVKPDILIEDDCKSIGGEKEMCITKVPDLLKAKISSIVVEEFTGIDDIVL